MSPELRSESEPSQDHWLSLYFQHNRRCINTPNILTSPRYFHTHADFLVRVSLLLRLLLHHGSGFSSLFTTYEASWLATVLVEKAGILTVSLLVNRKTLLPS